MSTGSRPVHRTSQSPNENCPPPPAGDRTTTPPVARPGAGGPAPRATRAIAVRDARSGNAGTRQRHLRGEHPIRVEPAFSARQLDEGTDQQRGADEERAGQRDLANQQALRHEPRGARFGAAALGETQRLVGVDPRANPGRQDACCQRRDDARERRDGKRTQCRRSGVERAQ